MKSGVRYLAVATSVAFIILMAYLTYIQVIAGERLYLSPLNPRLALVEKNTQRGTIYDRAGRVLASSTGAEGSFQRHYPYGAAAAAVVGYVSERYGNSGLEASRAGDLLGLNGWQRFINEGSRLAGQVTRGNDLHLTLDAEWQQLATRLLDGRRGAVVALEPQSGAVRVLASSPGYDPNRLEEQWQQINASQAGSPLLNRAVQGLYPPGSIFKLVTAAAALEVDPGILKRQFFCPGHLEVKGWQLTCPRSHGEINFQGAVKQSCNVTFASLALEAGRDQFKEVAARFGFGRSFDFDLPLKKSLLPEQLDDNMMAESSIGQGEVLATPLQMALVSAAIANRGIMMQPYLVASINSAEGQPFWQYQSRPLQIVTGAGVAAALKEAMVATVNEGTATAAALPGVQVAAKTGSAQNPGGEAHAWLVAFAPADDPQLAVVVVVENGGSGGAVAAPIARDILAAALRR